MKTIFYHPTIKGLLSLWLLFICLCFVWAMIRLWQQKRYRLLLPAGILFAVCDVYWQYLNAYSFFVGYNKEFYQIDYAPIWQVVLANSLLTLVAAGSIMHIVRWQKGHISAVSVKEGFDTLPVGICFYEKGGRIYLVNSAMEALTQVLVGKRLYNAQRLWDLLKEQSIPLEQDNQAVVSVGEKTFGFTRYSDNVGGQELFEILAVDISQEAQQNRQLAEKNEELERLNLLLQEHNRNLADAVREREILQSKARIHDEMNILLVSTLNSIEHYEAEEAERIASLWKSNILALQRDTEPYRKNPLDTLLALAQSLGITLEFQGTLPQKKEHIRLWIAGVSECMVNAIRHAGATVVYVVSDAGGVCVTNNGVAPCTEIEEGDGLSNLRKKAQAIGATVVVQSLPAFELRITY